jgi:FlaA1/EpsC-like NDP-sugar epimerase
MRPGEKLLEELSLRTEQLAPTLHPRIRCLVSADELKVERIEAGLLALQSAVNTLNGQRAIALLKELVPDYDPSPKILSEYPFGAETFRQG